MRARPRSPLLRIPHAPSGTLLPVAELEQLARSFSGVLLIDEAYVDFIDPERDHQTSQLVMTYPNVLLLRTLSKGYSLAGDSGWLTDLARRLSSLRCFPRQRTPTTSTRSPN